MKLYHVTPPENLDGIMRRGLIPQTGKYAEAMEETGAAVWLFKSIDDAEEMASIWLEPFYGKDLVFLEVDIPEGFPLEDTGSDYEVMALSHIPAEWITVVY